MAQFGSASDLGSEGRGFKSHLVDHLKSHLQQNISSCIGRLAQLVEHQFVKLKVLGSSPKLFKVACISVGGIAAIAAGCKPVTLETRRFESYPTDQIRRWRSIKTRSRQ